jgi:hypothetical protein
MPAQIVISARVEKTYRNEDKASALIPNRGSIQPGVYDR